MIVYTHVAVRRLNGHAHVCWRLQVEWAMAVNRRSERPVGLHATGWQGEVAAFGTYIGCAGWPVVLHDKPLLQVFPAERVSNNVPRCQVMLNHALSTRAQDHAPAAHPCTPLPMPWPCATLACTLPYRSIRPLGKGKQPCIIIEKSTRPCHVHMLCLCALSLACLRSTFQPLVLPLPALQIIVLSPDAEAPLTTLSESDVYVIGGIVDRTIRKGVTASFAVGGVVQQVRPSHHTSQHTDMDIF